MGRQPCCDGREGLKKGPWSAEEDRKLVSFISTHGHGCWREVPKLAGLLRCGKSCRLRWINYLRPDLKRGMLSPEEENLIIHLHASYGNKWSRIAAQLPGRTDNEIKNCWNTRIKKKLKDMGIDPVTHRPLSGVNGPPGLSHTTGVNVPPGWIHRTPSLGHLPREPFNASAYQYNMMAKRLQQEGLVGASPNSVMSPQVTTSLSHTPPNTKCDDEHSINYSADSDRSLDSNVLANVHELRSIDKVQGDPHMMLACQLNGKDGLQNASHMLRTCQAAPTASHELYNPPHMHNPPYMLHDALDMHYPSHMLHNAHNLSDTIHNASHMHPHMLRIGQLQASHAAQTMPHLVPAFQLRGLHASSPARKMEDTRIASSSSMVRNDDDGCDEGNEAGVAAIKEENERMLASNYMKNVSPYVPASMIKYSQVGVEPQTSQYELQDEEGTSTSVLTTTQGGGQWSNMMSEVFLSEPADAVAREPQVMSPLLYETSQALGQHNFASACNSLNIGQWSNTDCLWF